MANKSQIASRIEKKTGSMFPNINQLTTLVFKKDRDNVIKMLEGLPTVKDGRQYKYFSEDVAERIMEMTNKNGKESRTTKKSKLNTILENSDER